MASNYTENFGLCQWEATDAVLRTDFNEDNKKMDTALKGLETKDAALEKKIASQATAIAKLGNCLIQYSTYVGDGGGGEDAPCTLNCSARPMLVIISEKDGTSVVAARGAETAYRRATGAGYIKMIWADRSVSWYHPDGSAGQMNTKGTTYHVVVFLDANQ